MRIANDPVVFFARAPQGCGQIIDLGPGAQVKCNACGSRILWKLRTKKVVQYEAR